MTSSSSSNDLFSPVAMGALNLANRIVMAPLTRSRMGPDGVPNEMHARYYAQRASAGLIISEATNISAQGRGYAPTPGIWTDEQVAGWKKVTDAVHTAGGLIVCQLWHVGRFSHVDLQPDGASPVAPSAIQAQGQTYTEKGMLDVSMPRALETSEIPDIIQQYKHAAKCAQRAGFDGVEVHSANSYLLDQFLRDSTNRRSDSYGGTIENRSRLTLEVTAAVVEVWGHDRVGIRLSPVTPDAGNTPLDSQVMQTYGHLIDQLNRFQLAYMHFVEGATATSRSVSVSTPMKTTFIKTLIFAAIAVGMGATAQAADLPTPPQTNQGKAMSKPTYVHDYQAISEVLNKYIEGCKQAKSSIMKSAFSPQATMYSVGPDGKLTGGAIPILFEGIDKDFRPSPDATAAITRIEIVGTTASARIDANDMSGISFTDFFHLLKVDGKWTVISKIFHTHAAS